MDAAVLYYNSITKYRNFKCNATGRSKDCLQGEFDGEEYFDNYILKHDGPSLFGKSTRMKLDENGVIKKRGIKLDENGDRKKRFAIYQLQSLTYQVRSFENLLM